MYVLRTEIESTLLRLQELNVQPVNTSTVEYTEDTEGLVKSLLTKLSIMHSTLFNFREFDSNSLIADVFMDIILLDEHCKALIAHDYKIVGYAMFDLNIEEKQGFMFIPYKSDLVRIDVSSVLRLLDCYEDVFVFSA